MKKILTLFLSILVAAPAFAGNSTFDTAGSTSDGNISTTDVTTNDVSTTKHGFYPKLPSIPTFVALGASAHGTGAVVPTLPVGHTTNDILLLFVQTSNEAVTAPAGYSQIGPQPGNGIAVTALSNRLAIFWKRDGGSESDPTVADPGDHAIAYMIAIRGCTTTGDPFQFCYDGFKATASTTGTANGYTTFAPNTLIVVAVAHSVDTTSAQFSSWTNSSLASVTERGDDATTDGTGGGIGVATGTLAVAGDFGSTTVTEGNSTNDAFSTFAMLPNNYNQVTLLNRVPEIQTFCARGVDNWTKPTGAVRVFVQMTAAGGGGGGGRNAATAAGGGGGGGGQYDERQFRANDLGATVSLTVPAGGAASADSDGSAGNNGADALFGTEPGAGLRAKLGNAGVAGASADGGNGGAGGGTSVPAAATAAVIAGRLGVPGGSGTTVPTGGSDGDYGGGGGECGGDTDTAGVGGKGKFGGGGGAGGRSNTNVSTGGPGGGAAAPSGVAGTAGTASSIFPYGGSGGVGGTSAARGAAGGYPGGGGGGGGTGSGTQGGGAGADGCIVVTTYY